MAIKILDSFALLAFLQDEPGAQTVEDFILQAQDGKINLAMCVVNLGEIWYSISRKSSAETADHYIEQIQGLPIEIINADWKLTRLAAAYKVNRNVSYADCYVVALAKLYDGQVITGDREFKFVENEIEIIWLR